MATAANHHDAHDMRIKCSKSNADCQPALNYWELQAAEQVHFCTVTALGLVHLLSQPKLMGPAVKTRGEPCSPGHQQRLAPCEL